jgi:hypothetical protein
MNWVGWIVNFLVLGVPPLSCLCAWWFWLKQDQNALPRWRQITTIIDLVAFTISIALGAFAFEYWQNFPAPGHGYPEATRVTILLGFFFAVFGLPFSVLARSWNRVALVCCSLALLAFYFGMFIAG